MDKTDQVEPTPVLAEEKISLEEAPELQESDLDTVAGGYVPSNVKKVGPGH